MIKIFVLLILTQSLFGFQPLRDTYNWIEKEYKEFRTYPRIDKAYKYIEKGEDKEAKILLEKVLEIDPLNTNASKPLISLCLRNNDKKCIRKYTEYLLDKDLAYYNLYNAEVKLKIKNYNRAIFYSKEALKLDLKAKDRYFAKLILIESYIRLGKYDKASLNIDKLYYSKNIPRYEGFCRNLVKLSIQVGRVDLGKKFISKYKESGNTPTDEQLWKWSHTSYNLKDVQYAYTLASGLSINEKHLKWQIDLLTKLKKYHRASVKMELLYKINKTKEHKKRLVFLYELAGEEEKIVALHERKLKKGCNSYSLYYLLDYYKNDNLKQKKLLLENYPFSCLGPRKQIDLTFALLVLLENEDKKIIDLYLSKLTARDDLVYEDYLKISNLYNKISNCEKSIKYAQKYLEKYPENINALKNAGYCYDKKGKKGLAGYYLSRASLENPSDLELSKNVGYIYVDLQKLNKALRFFYPYLRENKDPKLSLYVAHVFFDLNMYNKSKKVLNQYEKDIKTYPYDYYVLKAKLLNIDGHCNKSAKNYEKALSMKSEEYVMYEYANLLKTCNKDEKAILILKSLSTAHTDNLQYKKDLAYVHIKMKNYEEAIKYYKEITLDEQTKENYLTLAYLYKSKHKDDKAIVYFKKAIDKSKNDIIDEEWLYNIKNEVKYTSQKFEIYFAETARLDSYDSTQSSSPIHNASYVGGGILRVGYKPKYFKKHLTFFAEAVHTNDGNFIDTIQPSLGVKYQPFLDYDFALSVQKMFDTSKYSVSDTFIRASAGFFDGYEYKLDKTAYFYHSLYLDAGYYIENDSSILYANYELGKMYTLSTQFSFLPYITTGATYNNQSDESVSKFDVGVGLSILTWFDDSKYESYRFTSRLKLEARGAYAGNAKDDNTVRLQFELLY